MPVRDSHWGARSGARRLCHDIGVAGVGWGVVAWGMPPCGNYFKLWAVSKQKDVAV